MFAARKEVEARVAKEYLVDPGEFGVGVLEMDYSGPGLCLAGDYESLQFAMDIDASADQAEALVILESPLQRVVLALIGEGR